ncbi:unnamed protein product [Dovyalis caffra]|uniref:C3H1-type domain-containing protein n=1 Tax=Dovyalis caffra TaxID=77055 RepID=A0AAV1S6R4_9ROSI|nr:unnamed protein product [Dovyalis caffra]
MESLNKSVNKDSILVTYLRGGAGSPMKSPGSDRFSCNYQRSSSGSSRSPLSPLQNVKTPMMAEDEVLVMDGVLVSPLVGSRSSSNSSSSSSGKSAYKKELCRAWEDLGHCRYASNCQYSKTGLWKSVPENTPVLLTIAAFYYAKCVTIVFCIDASTTLVLLSIDEDACYMQFAHGKEELHPTHLPIKNKAVVHTCKSYASSPRSSPYVSKCRIIPPALTKVAVAANQTAFSAMPEYASISPITISSEKSSKDSSTPISTPDHFGRTYIPTRPEHCNKSPAGYIKSEESRMVITATISLDCWLPEDDGIEIALPHQTDKFISREEVDAHIHSVLYGPATKKRLPVFRELCPG